MRCDNCGKHEAAIHLTQIENDQMTTRHLCEGCAAAKGLETGVGGAGSGPLADFLAQMGKTGATGTAAPAGACPGCGLTLADFKRTGRLGCSRCWSTFDGSLRGLLRKLHGGTQHVGKVYLPPDPTEMDRTARAVSLRRSLQRAVDEEDFERAAALRDQIRRLEAVE
ncbi:MAG TPA: UvrB/UvrC motif-containing protein [Longimicrobiaceae bacterium]|jgi:protein arginine kinase activator|nr:UvrB/UvrC motif-containing protein [Longimicrobiaceae bacterium]